MATAAPIQIDAPEVRAAKELVQATAPAMGTTAHVVVLGGQPAELLTAAFDRIADLERKWSRFLPDSEVSRLNRAGGECLDVSGDTVQLFEYGIAGWRLSNGAFDPTMAHQIRANGYDRSFDLIDTTVGRKSTQAAVGCDDIVVDPYGKRVRLPAELGFDPGGFAKGLAADMVSAELLNMGAAGVLVSLGGDLAVRGTAPDGVSWTIDVREPTISPECITTLHVNNAGLATSTTQKRRWQTPAGTQHHILSPNTGRPVVDGPILATVVAGSAWWAEVTATGLLVDIDVARADDAALLLYADARIDRLGEIERFES